ncbi:hypothetical protein ACI750_18270 [Aeromonas caviae]|nr:MULTISPECIES: hypothetical protein [Aeromonas]
MTKIFIFCSWDTCSHFPKTMKSWIKYGLAGALILVASFWGGSVRAAQMPLGWDAALPVQITGQDAAVLTVASFLSLGE